MALKDLSSDEIIRLIKEKKTKYSRGDGCLYFNNEKFSPVGILNDFYFRASCEKDTSKNLYAKLLSILPELNKSSIYLKTPNKYLKKELLAEYGITREEYDSQLQIFQNIR